MARGQRRSRRSGRERQGILSSLREGAEEAAQTFAVEVVPGVIDAVDVDGVVRRIDVQAIIDRVDFDAVLAGMDIDAVMDRLDVDSLLARVDIEVLLQDADLDRLLARVDVQALVDRLDLEEILARVDLNALLGRIDVDAVIARTEIGVLVSRSGTAVIAQSLDLVRSQGVGLDSLVHSWMDRLLRRSPSTVQNDPPVFAATRGDQG